jgi:hypothetical protein
MKKESGDWGAARSAAPGHERYFGHADEHLQFRALRFQ